MEKAKFRPEVDQPSIHKFLEFKGNLFGNIRLFTASKVSSFGLESQDLVRGVEIYAIFKHNSCVGQGGNLPPLLSGME